VIRIDWTQINHSSPEEMKASLTGYLNEIAGKYNVALTQKSPSDCFRELIHVLREKTGKDVGCRMEEMNR
jgi:hypothetical protein